MGRQSCADCHFFVQSYRDSQPPPISVVSEQNRAATRQGDFSWNDDNKAPVALSCYMDVWDQGVSGFPRDKRYDLIVGQNRRGFCFFRKYQPGMLLSAAKELQKREMEADRWRKERRLTVLGLWIAAVALILTVILEAVGLT